MGTTEGLTLAAAFSNAALSPAMSWCRFWSPGAVPAERFSACPPSPSAPAEAAIPIRSAAADDREDLRGKLAVNFS